MFKEPSQALKNLAWKFAGLLHPEWMLRLGSSKSQFPEAHSKILLSSNNLDNAVLTNKMVKSADGLLARKSQWTDCSIGTLEVSDLSNSVFIKVRFGLIAGCVLPYSKLENVDIASSVMVDFSDSKLINCRMGRARTADFTGCVFEKCDLRKADLRGAILKRVKFVDTDPSVALVEGADFRGATGLDKARKRILLSSGARFRAPLWYALLKKLVPKADPLELEKYAARFNALMLVIAVLISVGATVAALWPPPGPAIPEVAPPRSRECTTMEIDETQANLAKIREALEVAHKKMIANGAVNVVWPSIIDLQQNRYDIDGDAALEEYAELVKGGLPSNLLSDATGGVLPYCNEVPTQETLSGVDADWHYCHETGRIFASAGYTNQRTMDW